MAEEHGEDHLTAALPGSSAKASLEPHEDLHGASRTLSSLGSSHAKYSLMVMKVILRYPSIGVSQLAGAFPFLLLSIQTAHTIKKFAQHIIRRGVDLRRVGVYIVARVMRIDKGGQPILRDRLHEVIVVLVFRPDVSFIR